MKIIGSILTPILLLVLVVIFIGKVIDAINIIRGKE
jgi:branched-subunit amino acid permease